MVAVNWINSRAAEIAFIVGGSAVAIVVLFCAIHVLCNKSYSLFYRALWVILIMVVPFWGSLVYWLYGRKVKGVDLEVRQQEIVR